MHDSILTHAKSRYLWISIGLSVVSIALYLWHDPGVAPNGGTWLGYTLGTIAALIIVLLLLFGVGELEVGLDLHTTLVLGAGLLAAFGLARYFERLADRLP